MAIGFLKRLFGGGAEVDAAPPPHSCRLPLLPIPVRWSRRPAPPAVGFA